MLNLTGLNKKERATLKTGDKVFLRNPDQPNCPFQCILTEYDVFSGGDGMFNQVRVQRTSVDRDGKVFRKHEDAAGTVASHLALASNDELLLELLAGWVAQRHASDADTLAFALELQKRFGLTLETDEMN